VCFPFSPSYQLSVAAVPRPSAQASTLSISSWLLLHPPLRLPPTCGGHITVCPRVLASVPPSVRFLSFPVHRSLAVCFRSVSCLCVLQPIHGHLWPVPGCLFFSPFSAQLIVLPAIDSLSPTVLVFPPCFDSLRFQFVGDRPLQSPTSSLCSCGHLSSLCPLFSTSSIVVPASAIIPLAPSPPTVCLVIRMHPSSALSWICVRVLLPSNLSSGGCRLPVPPLRSSTPPQGRALPFGFGLSHR
jgi:hypothetical protein